MWCGLVGSAHCANWLCSTACPPSGPWPPVNFQLQNKADTVKLTHWYVQTLAASPWNAY